MEYLKKAAVRSETEECGRSVAEIIRNVRSSGDRALLEYNARFDGSDRTELRVTREEIDSAYARMTERELSDLRQAAEHIRAFARAQRDCIRELDGFPLWRIPFWDTGLFPCPPAAAMCPGAPTPSSPPR